ncbi:unnamed protein product [Phaedon cochleariae]|uniref:SET domain-containing protein n=1 Tax=Phaedon cochleariae TaxID=80249 RepID=A0A9P0GVH1_PHACE|nr:unnamed protein product [Phaedon cochleariae]
MGRTKRKRSRRFPAESIVNNDQSIIKLQKWMVRNGWKNEQKLILKSFPGTGRGLSSNHTIQPNDVLITIPFELMITYGTLKDDLLGILSPGTKLTVHELLSLFLVYEFNKKETSPWKYYIDSLPLETPHLPWYNSTNELHALGKKMHDTFMNSFEKVRASVRRKVIDHIGFNENIYKWAYVMVNTRAVYVDPNLVGRGKCLLDEPCLALCPFLDMFNHHFSASTEATLKNEDGRLVYQLKTLSAFKKYSQIFISYGSHNNIKLLMEYGFFIPKNIYDVIKFTFSEVLAVIDMDLSQAKYRYICDHLFTDDLYVSLDGLSYNLRAVLFVGLCGDERNFNSVIFSDTYPEQFISKLPKFINILLDYKSNIFQDQYNELKCTKAKESELVEQFLLYRITFLSDIKNKFVVDICR